MNKIEVAIAQTKECIELEKKRKIHAENQILTHNRFLDMLLRIQHDNSIPNEAQKTNL